MSGKVRLRPRRTRLLLAASLVAALGVAILSAVLLARGSSIGKPAARATTPAQNEPSASASSGHTFESAPDFTLATVGGGTLSLATQRGRVVVLDFTAPDCPTCAKQIPVLDKAAGSLAPRGVTVSIVDVSGDSDDHDLRSAYSNFGWTPGLVIAKDVQLRVANSYQINQMGMTVIVGRDGTIRWRGAWEDESTLLSAIGQAT